VNKPPIRAVPYKTFNVSKNLLDSVTIHVYKSSLENSLNPHSVNNFICVYYVYTYMMIIIVIINTTRYNHRPPRWKSITSLQRDVNARVRPDLSSKSTSERFEFIFYFFLTVYVGNKVFIACFFRHHTTYDL